MSATTSARHLREPLTSARLWHTVDAAGHRVGRLSTQIAKVLMGKHKLNYNSAQDTGDYVVVYNAEKVLFTGKKWLQKLYRWHTRYPGGLKEVPAKNMLFKHPDNIVRKAVKGMLPRNRLRHSRMRRLRIYVGTEHPHAAQVCPSTQYKFKKFEPKVKEEKSTITPPEEWKAWEQDIEAHKEQPELLVQRFGGGTKAEMTFDANNQPIVTETEIPAIFCGVPKDARHRRTRRTERLRVLVEGINQDIKAEKLWRERLH